MARKRTTRDVWEVQTMYCGRWECEYTATTKAEARGILADYRKNVPTFMHQIVKKRERIELCKWFLKCDHEANGTEPHVVLGDVPICDRCRAWLRKVERS